MRTRTRSGQGPQVFSTTPRTIILAGALGAPEMLSLANYCEQLHRGGQAELHLNMAGVTDCHRAGLEGLCALAAGSAHIDVRVDGARWGHFMRLLSTASIDEIQDLCDSVRQLLPHPAPDH